MPSATEEKTGKGTRRMRGFFFLLACAAGLHGASMRMEIVFAGEPAVVVRALQESFAKTGQAFEIDSFHAGKQEGQLSARVSGYKPFAPDLFDAALQEAGITVEKAVSAGDDIIKLTVDAKEGRWSLPMITAGEGAQLERTNVPKWFGVLGGEVIGIESSYGGRWYPEVAVLDGAMRPLVSIRSLKGEESLELELPATARYLKVSNAWGMKMLKEGMWIESIAAGQ